jgi:hypothetical protein
MVNIEWLIHEALDVVTIDDWNKCVSHIEKIQTEDKKN